MIRGKHLSIVRLEVGEKHPIHCQDCHRSRGKQALGTQPYIFWGHRRSYPIRGIVYVINITIIIIIADLQLQVREVRR